MTTCWPACGTGANARPLENGRDDPTPSRFLFAGGGRSRGHAAFFGGIEFSICVECDALAFGAAGVLEVNDLGFIGYNFRSCPVGNILMLENRSFSVTQVVSRFAKL